MKNNFYKIFIYSLVIIIFNSCSKEESKEQYYKKGKVDLSVDPSFYELALSLNQVFNTVYPKAIIDVQPQAEALAINNFINGNATVIMVGRNLTDEEANFIFNRTKKKYKSAQIACDGVIFITSKKNNISELSIQTLKTDIVSENSKYVFDGIYTSNYNTLKNILKFKFKEGEKINSFKDAQELINYIDNNPSYIGITGLSTLNYSNDENFKKILNNIKILPIRSKDGEIISPNLESFKSNKYPFTRRIYLLNAENGFGIGSSFLRFSTSQRGQLIVSKEGYQPYYLYERNINITK
ncbi:hypothetical protein ETU08_05290 [Apibacter muscae]|uniref:PstS family phosphate ABC transporter substrate-binding protein n=1 Tax=Apibacter muscae TaxID=2509004 RepID=UPI0011AD5F27|nr:substrate-binding domain-containing protein [Apibacter muscae]TWP24462.1 hypothetical protein ETU10_04260 [Apibacter muscae]TWP29975.1 hypothetical protein ETU08_05290 [Apibacter muscae]